MQGYHRSETIVRRTRIPKGLRRRRPNCQKWRRCGAGSPRLNFRGAPAVQSPCGRCGGTVERLVQAQRSTFFCPGCQWHPRRRSRTL
ncbi:MAG: zinc finger domain-containing protein [Planctomycetia bacterium]